MIIIISISAFVCTLLGGLFALKFKDKLHLILGFSAGAIIAVALFDLIPETIELVSATMHADEVMAVVGLGFLLYMILDRTIILHHHHSDHHDHAHNHRGNLGAASLSLHSFLDGTAIGLAFQVSVEVGFVVAISILIHKFSDGLNTVNMILKNNGTTHQAIHWTIIASVMPLLGVASTIFFTLPENTLGIILALFSGFFLYVGASDLLPESHHNHPTTWTTISTVLGMLLIFTIIQFAHAMH
jgi:ZIP family zinc transporter